MPYFIYRIQSERKLEKIDAFPKYREAKEMIRTIRSQEDSEADTLIRMIFANNQTEAEQLLRAPRDDRIIGDD